MTQKFSWLWDMPIVRDPAEESIEQAAERIRTEIEPHLAGVEPIWYEIEVARSRGIRERNRGRE
jgi:hypothetical protein